MAGNVATLRSQVETALAGRVPAPFTCRDFRVETAPFNILGIDILTGGLPRGSLTEIYGPPCSGRTTLLMSILASRTAHGEVCALVDGRDGFDPHTARASGVNLEQLLWVRCRTIDQALRATDLLIQGGGFGLVALDLSDILEKTVHCVPLNAWFRFRRAVENTSTILLLLDQEPNARTCASLVLRLSFEPARWSTTPSTQTRELPYACLFDGSQIRAELFRSRLQPAIGARGRHDFARTGESGSATIIETKTSWGFISALE